MKKIFKYPVNIVDRQEIEMPEGAEILTVQNQGGVICLWAIVDPEKEKLTRTIRIIGTGHDIADGEAETLIYIGTVQTNGGAFVWHIFEA